MKLKKFSGLLAMFAITLSIAFTFTACEDTTDPGTVNPTSPIPRVVDTVKAGAISETSIRVEWSHSKDKDSTWFKEYRVIATKIEGTETIDTMIVAKTLNFVSFTVENAIQYKFEVFSVNDSNKYDVNNVKSITWAASKHFDKTDNGQIIRIYGNNSGKGSGLQFYGPNSAPTTWLVSGGESWNIGLSTKDGVLVGSASKLGFTTVKPTEEALITEPIDFDTDVLNNLYLTKNLSGEDFQSRAINLETNSIAKANSKGIVFFAKVGTNYAKVIVKKIGGSYLQDAGENDEYVELLISYQAEPGVPYAKIFQNK